MPIGLVGAPATFQRLMNTIFADIPDHIPAYMDDLSFLVHHGLSTSSMLMKPSADKPWLD